MSDKRNQEKKELGTHINILMSPKCNELLARSADLNGRSKRQEASKRLEHHLECFLVDWVESDLTDK